MASRVIIKSFRALTGRPDITVGKGRVTDDGKLIPLDVKKGDTILLSKYGGTDVRIDDREYLILREDDVLGVVDSGLS